MKKIAILTWLHNENFGSILQAYALQRFLRDEGYDVNNIDLKPTIIEKLKNCIQQHNPFGSLFKEKLIAYTARKNCPDKEALNKRTKKFSAFLTENFILTRTFRQFAELKEISNSYDVYICGSDQIWSPMLLSPSYYFSFLPDKAKKIGYACSFGMDYIPKQKQQRIQQWLNRFNSISVRENSGKTIVNNLIKKDVLVTVDPSLLLTVDEWNKLLENKMLYNKPYMLCYFLGDNKKYWEKVSNIAKSRSLKIVIIPTIKGNYNYGDLVAYDVGPLDWINLIKYSDFVATDSFHACCFSIIYKKQFCVFKRFADKNHLSQNSRIYNLLSKYDIKNCLAQDLENFIPMEIPDTKYNEIIKMLGRNSDESKKWLINAIE